MTSEWRPANWANPYKNVPYADYQVSLWEGGADAMLAALRREFGILAVEGLGTRDKMIAVFIPGELKDD